MKTQCGRISRLQKIETSLENGVIGKLAEFPILVGFVLIGSLIVASIFALIYRCGG